MLLYGVKTFYFNKCKHNINGMLSTYKCTVMFRCSYTFHHIVCKLRYKSKSKFTHLCFCVCSSVWAANTLELVTISSKACCLFLWLLKFWVAGYCVALTLSRWWSVLRRPFALLECTGPPVSLHRRTGHAELVYVREGGVCLLLSLHCGLAADGLHSALWISLLRVAVSFWEHLTWLLQCILAFWFAQLWLRAFCFLGDQVIFSATRSRYLRSVARLLRFWLFISHEWLRPWKYFFSKCAVICWY